MNIRYYYPERNTQLFAEPLVVSDFETLESALEQLYSVNIIEHVHMQRASTKYKLLAIVQVVFYVYYMDFPIGNNGGDDIPNYLPYFIGKKCQNFTVLPG